MLWSTTLDSRSSPEALAESAIRRSMPLPEHALITSDKPVHFLGLPATYRAVRDQPGTSWTGRAVRADQRTYLLRSPSPASKRPQLLTSSQMRRAVTAILRATLVNARLKPEGTVGERLRPRLS